jgi:hypothetical protein
MTNPGVFQLLLYLRKCRGGTRQVIMTRISWATHVLQGKGQWVPQTIGANPETFSQFRLLSATRKYEGGIASNRTSAEVR